MATRTLRELCEEIQELIHQEQIPEALRTARHVLAYFPRHLETYTLVGEACLKSGNVHEAVEMFQRALGADPEQLRAWLGLASACEQDELPEKALWYLERAFEVDPSHAGIRAELKRLYTEVQGVKVLRVKLNCAALGRIYLCGGLYQLAVDEFREVLTRHPEYYHLRTGLAQALWYLGRHVEAAQVCQALLDDLPNCLEALLILGEIWSRGDHPEQGQSLLQAAEKLDPENLKAQEIFGPDSPLPPKNPTLPAVDLIVKPEEKGEAPVPTCEGALPPEVACPGEEAPQTPTDRHTVAVNIPAEPHGQAEAALDAEGPIEETAPAEEAIEAEEMVREISALEVPAEPVPGYEVADEVEIPPWLRVLAEAEEEALPMPGETPLQEAEEEVPEWLHRLAEQSVLGEEEAAEEKEPEPEESGVAPEWLLSGEIAEERSEAEERVPEAGEETMPDWLQRLREAAIQDVPALESELEVPAEPVLIEPVSGVAEEPALAPEEEEMAPLIAEVEAPASETSEELEVEPTPPAEGAAAEASLEEPEEEGLVASEMSESMWEEMYLSALVDEGEPPMMEKIAPVEDLTSIEEVECIEEPLASVEAAPAEELPTAEETPQEEMTEAIEAEEVVAAPAEEAEAHSYFLTHALERLSVHPGDHEMRLAAARALCDAGRLGEAISHYEALIEAGQFIDAIVGDLEHTAPEVIIPEQSARLWTVLGDAYMRQGRLTDALQAYRHALSRSA